MQSELRGGSTNPNAYNQFLMTAERNRGHMYCPMPSEFVQRKKIRAQAGIEPTTLGGFNIASSLAKLQLRIVWLRETMRIYAHKVRSYAHALRTDVRTYVRAGLRQSGNEIIVG